MALKPTILAQLKHRARYGDYDAAAAMENKDNIADLLGIVYKPRVWAEVTATPGERNVYIELQDLNGTVVTPTGAHAVNVLIDVVPQFNFMAGCTYLTHTDGPMGYYVGPSPASYTEPGWAQFDAGGGSGTFIQTDHADNGVNGGNWVLLRITVDGALPIQFRLGF